MRWVEAAGISRLRRNHGLEHATIHVLSRSQPRVATAGYSNPGGFWLLGELSTEAVQAAVMEALRRLQAGERQLAIHPNCGTNLVTAGMAAGLGSALALGTARDDRQRLERLPLAFVLASAGLLLARPLGTRLQQYVTTSGDPGRLHITRIQRSQLGTRTLHRIDTAD